MASHFFAANSTGGMFPKPTWGRWRLSSCWQARICSRESASKESSVLLRYSSRKCPSKLSMASGTPHSSEAAASLLQRLPGSDTEPFDPCALAPARHRHRRRLGSVVRDHHRRSAAQCDQRIMFSYVSTGGTTAFDFLCQSGSLRGHSRRRSSRVRTADRAGFDLKATRETSFDTRKPHSAGLMKSRVAAPWRDR